ncbi:adenosylcobinamide-GDP ribazoletransferase [Paenibacillus zeisoli]|uniref:Adenosylcobinamide-GDP ribazoletransferase n=1 Tax=Paenibacillus zeisoli TaxID=2496267 RepID=A0A3S1B6A3_9BACL|nr:adenosylcobinamide-GDP ribazoletransferase [Paenibacillus zeisoli]RUT28417.1 adenosylcobinamide-GDP ribazoletransferase [Paenibacillus zeisoli]
MRGRGHAILAAFQFLSRFPVTVQLDFTPELLKRSTRFYPLVGSAIGIVICLLSLISAWALPPLPASVVILIGWVYLTGGLHLDGWMDAADGLLSYRSREKMLEIMKDSRVGAMGVIACVLLLLLKVTLIASLLEKGALPLALLTVPLWSRWFMVHAIAGWPSARGVEGLAGQFDGMNYNSSRIAALLALLLSGAALVLLLLSGYEAELNWVQLGICYAAEPAAAWLIGSLAASKISSRLGGLTGDIYGALNEGLEVLLMLILVIIIH